MITASLFNSIKNALDGYFDRLSYVWKDKESQDEFSFGKPEIYLFTCPKTERDDNGWPLKSPVITVVLEGYSMSGNDNVELDVGFHICVVNSSIIDREISIGGEFLTSEKYTDVNVDCNLYKDCMTLGEITAQGVNSLESVCCVKDIKLIPPNPDLPDFPFCVCKVECKISMLQTRHGAPVGESFYNLL